MTSLRGPLLSQLFIYSFIGSLLKMFHSFASWSGFSSSSLAVGDPSRRRMMTEANGLSSTSTALHHVVFNVLFLLTSYNPLLSFLFTFYRCTCIFLCAFCRFPSSPFPPHLLMSIAFFLPTFHLVLLPLSPLRYVVPVKDMKRCVVYTGHCSTQNAKIDHISWMLQKPSMQISSKIPVIGKYIEIMKE